MALIIFSEKKIVRFTREWITVQTSDGKVEKYKKIQSPAPKPKQKKNAKPVQKRGAVCAEDMRPCSVFLHRMSDAEVGAAIEKVKLGELRKQQNANLSCKIIL